MKAPQLISQTESVFQSPESFEVLLQHWGKARIDTPLQLMARFDEAAKQLITIGGTLQGLLIAVFAFSNAAPRIPIWGIPVIVIVLLAFTFCAARVICVLPPSAESMGTYALFKDIGTTGVPNEELTAVVHSWCKAIDEVAKKKHWWLLAANVLFLVSSALTVILVLISMLAKG